MDSFRRITRRQKLKSNVSGWVLMIPGLALFGFFVWVPLLESIVLSLFNAKGMTMTTFAGLGNYIAVFRHPDFWPAMRNTFAYTFWSLLIGFFIPIFIALFIGETVRGRGIFRTASYFPNIVPGLATVLMWGFLLKPGATGVLNIMLGWFHISPMIWLNNSRLVIPYIVMVMTWKGAGATALIYMAGLAGVNSELYEAAAIDGAGIFQRVRHITFPAIFNLGSTLLILQIIAVFQILYEPLVMTNGGPNNASISIMQLVYKFAFDKYEYNKAAAVSVIISIVLIILTLAYNKLNNKFNKQNA